MTPVFLSIAGSDSSAGAGLQADLKTGFALGCYPLTAVTCVVSEVPGHVADIAPLPPNIVASQIRECLCTFPVAAVKTGMLYSTEILQATVNELPHDIPIVVDPVMIATAGDPLMQASTLQAYESSLFPRATLITPNLDELAALCRRNEVPDSVDELASAAVELSRTYDCAILAKGGHLPGATCTDLLVLPNCSVTRFSHARATGISTHGTGCTLSSAITAFLAKGTALTEAVESALAYTSQAIASSHCWDPPLFALNHDVCRGSFISKVSNSNE